MIEIRQGGKREIEEEVQATCQPKNFRQIGSPQGQQKIYFEDYVYTYLHPAVETAEETRICILLGRVEKENDVHYIFVNGAVELPGVNFAGSAPIFTEKTRQEICTLIKRHFDGLYLVGWYLDVKGNPPKLTPEVERIHRNFFGGKDKILLLSDSLNREEKVFAYDGNAIWQREGYYIYYEKNPKMQEYMISFREQVENTIEPEQVVDEALKNYRELLLKKEDVQQPRKWHLALYSTGFILMVSVCVLGANMISNRAKMKDMEGAITVLSNSLDPDKDTEAATENLVIIETVKGEVTPEVKEETPSETPINTETANLDKPPADTEPVDTEVMNTEAAKNETANNEAPNNEAPNNEEADPNQSASADEQKEPELSEAETIKLQGYYIVQKGDNLAAISRKIYQTTDMMAAICELNGIENSDQIFAGQKLTLP